MLLLPFLSTMMHSSQPLRPLFLLLAVVLGCCCVATASLSRDDPVAQAMQARLDDHDDTDDHEYSKDSDDHDFDDFAGLTDEELEAIEQQLLFLEANANNSTAVHRTLKKLKRLFPKYKTPKWFKKYSEMIGRPYLQKCNSWIIDHEVPPRSGSIYCPRRSGNYTCFFGEQMCPELRSSDRPHPNAQCTCVDKQWRCHDWECPEPFFYKKCPKKSPLGNPKVPTRCVGDKTCEYGTETCCGETFPSVVVSIRVTCVSLLLLLPARSFYSLWFGLVWFGLPVATQDTDSQVVLFVFLPVCQCKCVNGNYTCRKTHACRRRECEPIKETRMCPDYNPLETGEEFVCTSDLKCTYGEVSCCGGTITGPAVECTCDTGFPLSCSDTNICASPLCFPDSFTSCVGC